MEVIRHNGFTIEVVRKKIKHMNLGVFPPNGNVRISAPKLLPFENIKKFVESKLIWIEINRQKIKNRPPISELPPLTEEQLVLFKDSVQRLFDYWADKMNAPILGWRIRHMKTRWGSYSSRTRIVSLSSELARKSFDCVEYLIVHELAHVFVGGHGKKFQKIMSQYLPNWKMRKKELNSRK